MIMGYLKALKFKITFQFSLNTVFLKRLSDDLEFI